MEGGDERRRDRDEARSNPPVPSILTFRPLLNICQLLVEGGGLRGACLELLQEALVVPVLRKVEREREREGGRGGAKEGCIKNQTVDRKRCPFLSSSFSPFSLNLSNKSIHWRSSLSLPFNV